LRVVRYVARCNEVGGLGGRMQTCGAFEDMGARDGAEETKIA